MQLPVIVFALALFTTPAFAAGVFEGVSLAGTRDCSLSLQLLDRNLGTATFQWNDGEVPQKLVLENINFQPILERLGVGGHAPLKWGGERIYLGGKRMKGVLYSLTLELDRDSKIEHITLSTDSLNRWGEPLPPMECLYIEQTASDETFKSWARKAKAEEKDNCSRPAGYGQDRCCGWGPTGRFECD